MITSGRAPRLLVDEAVLDGSAAALPLSWLDGFDVLAYAPRQLAAAAQAASAEAVLVRSMTRVGAAELRVLDRVQAVATLSSGTDHLDESALARRGVHLCTGHGGNAVAVADWVQWALQRWAQGADGRDLQGKKVLVVGVGAVGQQVVQRLNALQVEVLACDPPRARLNQGFRSCDLDQALLDGVDAVTLHVPLTRLGPDATHNLMDARRLQQLRGAVLLNAARGGIVDAHEAARLRGRGDLAFLALDTFDAEPRVDPGVVAACDLATPHIAGHSIEGKLDVAWRAMTGLRGTFGLPPLAPLADAVADRLRGRDAVPGAFDGLDAVAAALHAECVRFETLRHAHARRQFPIL